MGLVRQQIGDMGIVGKQIGNGQVDVALVSKQIGDGHSEVDVGLVGKQI